MYIFEGSFRVWSSKYQRRMPGFVVYLIEFRHTFYTPGRSRQICNACINRYYYIHAVSSTIPLEQNHCVGFAEYSTNVFSQSKSFYSTKSAPPPPHAILRQRCIFSCPGDFYAWEKFHQQSSQQFVIYDGKQALNKNNIKKGVGNSRSSWRE